MPTYVRRREKFARTLLTSRETSPRCISRSLQLRGLTCTLPRCLILESHIARMYRSFSFVSQLASNVFECVLREMYFHSRTFPRGSFTLPFPSGSFTRRNRCASERGTRSSAREFRVVAKWMVVVGNERGGDGFNLTSVVKAHCRSYDLTRFLSLSISLGARK